MALCDLLNNVLGVYSPQGYYYIDVPWIARFLLLFLFCKYCLKGMLLVVRGVFK